MTDTSGDTLYVLVCGLYEVPVGDVFKGKGLPWLELGCCFDERLVVEPERGAIAAWGPTGAGVTAGHFYLSRGFFDALFADGQHTLGAATTAGKLEVYTHSSSSDYLVQTYVLLGDPATTLDLETEIVYGVYLPIIFH